MNKKPKSSFQKITTVVIWVMLITIIGGAVLTALSALGLI